MKQIPAFKSTLSRKATMPMVMSMVMMMVLRKENLVSVGSVDG